MNENVILEKNENYWDAENVSLQKVTFRYVLDQATALTAYESGEVDGVASIPSSDFARLKAENAGVQTSPSYGTVYYDFNCSAEPVNNVLVRNLPGHRPSVHHRQRCAGRCTARLQLPGPRLLC